MGLSSPRYLFVYGTLRKGSRNPHARNLAKHAEWAGEGRIPGRLYHLGRYPGLKRAHHRNEWVGGELYRLPAEPEPLMTLLLALDRYEGGDFERVAAVASRADGGRVMTWVYEYVLRVSEAWRIGPENNATFALT